MKRILLALLAIALLGGGYYVVTRKPTLPNVGQMVKDKAMGSIQDAITNAVSLKCEYPDEQGNTVTTYVKGTNIRMMGYAMAPGQTGHALMTNGKMYMWDDVKKQGTVLELNMEEVAQGVQDTGEQTDMKPPAVGAPNWQDTLAGLEKIKDSCKPETIAESMFTVPSDVTFTDLAKEMEKAGIDIEKMMDEAKKMQATPPQE